MTTTQANKIKNKFGHLDNIRNESDVEQNFINRLLDDLGFTEEYRETKPTQKESIGKARQRRMYVPDYICYLDKKHHHPILVIDAKGPNESAEDGVSDAQLYASIIHRKSPTPKPEPFCMGCNAISTIVRRYDSDQTLYELSFSDFVDDDVKYCSMKTTIGRAGTAYHDSEPQNDFKYQKPNIKELRGLFEACHDVIWKREFESPVPAFWEFCKLMFVKLHQDNRLHSDPELKHLIETGQPLPSEKVIFSINYIDRASTEDNPNPIAAIFESIRDGLESKIFTGEKKRIFDSTERLKLEPLTVRRVVELLQHHDLIKLDEDLNGRLFQTFLSATMRGKQLGQFFTPRTVVDFMCELADLKVIRTPPYAPLVLDACCGTGGFLIEAMAQMTRQLKEGPLSKTLTKDERERIEQIIKDQRLIGIDAGKDPPVARIARINMYLHGDGGSRIFSADALDKHILIPSTANPELKRELKELQGLFLGPNAILVDTILTNPPFSMKKEAKEADQKEILQEYKSGFTPKGVLRSSLKSNVMFLERYYDLLKPGGTFITVIDESVLNTSSDADHRGRLFSNFYIRAVFSLPHWAFFETGANVKTSILFLEKKKTPTLDQPMTFYGRSENIGYAGSKLDENKSDLKILLQAYRDYLRTSKVPPSTKNHWTERHRFYATILTEKQGRIDFEWNDPRHVEMHHRLCKIAKDKNYIIQSLGGAQGICDFITGKTAEEYVSEGIPILKVRNVTSEGIDWDCDYTLRSFYDANSDRHLLLDDVLVTTTGVGTIGRVDILNSNKPCMADGHVTGLRLKSPRIVTPEYLVHYLRSPLGQMQMERYTVGCTGQTELNDVDLEKLLVVFPQRHEDQEKVLSEAKKFEVAALRAREEYKHNQALALTEFERLLGL